MNKIKKAIIISASSEIGSALCETFVQKNIRVFGTYRNKTPVLKKLESLGVEFIYCNLSDKHSITNACGVLKNKCAKWDILIFCSGTQKPIGLFEKCDFNEWMESIHINFSRQMQILRLLLPFRNKDYQNAPTVLFFAGGGTNNATVRYSAYTVSKIALIKMCELLDSEIPDVTFAILGPGWVKTKIHQETIDAGKEAGDNLKKTLDNFEKNNFTNINDVIKSCEWIIDSPREVVGGRNFSTHFDHWGTEELATALLADNDMYKLRRHGNNKIVKGKQ